jgi:hypothetical protein
LVKNGVPPVTVSAKVVEEKRSYQPGPSQISIFLPGSFATDFGPDRK